MPHRTGRYEPHTFLVSHWGWFLAWGLQQKKKRNQDFWFPNFGAYYNKKIIWNFWGLLQPKKIISPPDPLVPLVPPASKVPSTCTSAGWPGCEATRLAAHSESAVPSENVSASKSFTATVLVGHGRPMGKNSWCQKYILYLYPCFSTKLFFPILLGKLRLKVSFNTIFVTGLCHISHILWISIFIFHSELYQTWLRCFTKFPIFLSHLLLPTLSPALPLALVDSGSSTAP